MILGYFICSYLNMMLAQAPRRNKVLETLGAVYPIEHSRERTILFSTANVKQSVSYITFSNKPQGIAEYYIIHRLF